MVRRLLLPSLCLLLTACSNPLSPPQGASGQQLKEVIATFQRVEHQFKTGQDQRNYPSLVVELNEAIAQLPTDTPPRVVKLLQGSAHAYTLAYSYWRCDQKSPGKERASCRDGELEKVIAHFPRIRRNITNRLIVRPNPPTYLSSSISTINMLQLLLMQAELNRVDAHLILTGGDFDDIYSNR